MDHKNSVSRLLISLLFVPGIVYAECYTRSATVSKLTSSIERVADLEKTVLPQGNGKTLCRVNFRAYIDSKWHTAQGEDVGEANDSLDNICSKAMNLGRISILEKVSGTKITANQEMICTDQPMPKDRPTVEVGDIIWESEVQVHPIYKEPFRFRGSICRWFIESRPSEHNIKLKQGVMCRAPEQKVFKVVDKW